MSTPQVQWQDVQNALREQHTESVPFAQYVVNIGAVQGGVINLAAAGERAADRIRPRREKPRILPRAVPGFLDREQEQGLAGQALARGQVVDLHGPDGMGKTALIGQVMRTQLPSAFPDGLVYLSARHETREDLLQDLFECFFESDGHVKVTENDVRRHVAGKRALVAVDDALQLEEGEAEALTQVAPQCAVMVAGQQQQVWQGASVALRGLPREQAVVLFEQRWGRISTQDRATVEAICDALDNVPLAVIKTATIAAQNQLPLDQVLQQIRSRTEKREPVRQAFELIASHLSAEERRVLGGLAAPGGETVGVEALPAITGLSLDEITRHLARLQEMELVHAHSPRYSLDDGLRPYIDTWVDPEMRSQAAYYYVQRVQQLQARSKDPDQDNVLAAMDYYFQQGQWKQVVYIARKAETYLATTGRWGQWQKRLNQAWHAAKNVGDRATEAWTQNQLGIVALGRGDTSAAIRFFQGALSMWQTLNDRAGIAIARWNLQILVGVPPTPPRKRERGGKPGKGGRWWIPFAVAGLAILAILAVIIGLFLFRPGPPEPGEPREWLPPPEEITPPVEPIERVEVSVWLGGGCDREYSPLYQTEVLFQSSVDGYITILLNGEKRLFARQIAGGETYAEDWQLPRASGEYYLTATLRGQNAGGECRFIVE